MLVTLLRKSKENSNAIKSIFIIIVITLFEILLVLQFKINTGTTEPYSRYLLGIWLLSILPIVTAYLLNGNFVLSTIIGFFIQLGCGVQAMCSSISKMTIMLFIATAYSGIVLAVYHKFFNEKFLKKHLKIFSALVILGSVAMAAALMLFGKEKNGTKAWIELLPGFEMQLTEFFKVAFSVTITLLFASELSDSKKVVAGTTVMVFYGLFFVMINELGTLLISGLVYLIIVFLFINDFSVLKKYSMVILAAVLLCVFVLYIMSLEIGSDIFPEKFTLIADKLISRWKIHLNPEKFQNNGGYQIVRAEKAIALGGWLGSQSNLPIPVSSSDLIFPYTIMRFGIIVGILMVIAYLIIGYQSEKIIIRTNDIYRRVFCSCIAATIFVQAFLIMFGSSNWTVLTGIPLPFVSDGGTSLCIMISFAYILIYQSSDGLLIQNIFSKKRFYKPSRKLID